MQILPLCYLHLVAASHSYTCAQDGLHTVQFVLVVFFLPIVVPKRQHPCAHSGARERARWRSRPPNPRPRRHPAVPPSEPPPPALSSGAAMGSANSPSGSGGRPTRCRISVRLAYFIIVLHLPMCTQTKTHIVTCTVWWCGGGGGWSFI